MKLDHGQNIWGLLKQITATNNTEHLSMYAYDTKPQETRTHCGLKAEVKKKQSKPGCGTACL